MLDRLKATEVKEVLILLMFMAFLIDTLTKTTIFFGLMGACMVLLKIKSSHRFRNIFALIIFGSYWFLYGKIIDPEIGLNFLTTIIVLKILEKNSQRDQFMIFMGLILLISAGSLFQKNILYVLFFCFSFFLLLHELYKQLGIKNRLVELASSFIWVLPLGILLFFFAPRMMNPFQIGKTALEQGEIGYTSEVNLSQIERVFYNDQVVFQAIVDAPIPGKDLYWRGNSLSFTDGWNWPLMPGDRLNVNFVRNQETSSNGGIAQKIRTYSQQEFFFGLDRPGAFISPKGVAIVNDTFSLPQSKTSPLSRYRVISFPEEPLSREADNKRDSFRHALNKNELKWVEDHFKETELEKIIKELQQYFIKEKFSYNLSPGKISNFLEFMQQKKMGFCSHYASAVAQILRVKKINARLISGFMGGAYNQLAGFYQVSQNDAHVWIEIWHEGRWMRLDPTEWIAPERVKIGGEAFMQRNLNSGSLISFARFSNHFKIIQDFEQRLAFLDFKFNVWLEEMDYYGQEAIFEKFNIQRDIFFRFFPLIILVFVALYAWQFTHKKKKRTELEDLWIHFKHKVESNKVSFRLYSILDLEKQVKKRDPKFNSIFKDLVEITFNEQDSSSLKELKKKIRRL
jgi:hypothetical protein